MWAHEDPGNWNHYSLLRHHNQHRHITSKTPEVLLSLSLYHHHSFDADEMRGGEVGGGYREIRKQRPLTVSHVSHWVWREPVFQLSLCPSSLSYSSSTSWFPWASSPSFSARFIASFTHRLPFFTNPIYCHLFCLPLFVIFYFVIFYPLRHCHQVFWHDKNSEEEEEWVW